MQPEQVVAFVVPRVHLRGQHPGSEEFVAGMAVHLLLERLEPVDVSLDRAGASGSVMAAATAALSRASSVANPLRSPTIADAIQTSRPPIAAPHHSCEAAPEWRPCQRGIRGRQALDIGAEA